VVMRMILLAPVRLVAWFVTALAAPLPSLAAETRTDCDLAASLAGHLPPPGHFAEISGSTFRDVMFPPEEARRMGIHSAKGPAGVITSWNGAAFDGCRMYFMGGGHHTYGGNEVYAYDFTTRLFLRLNDPAPLGPEIAPDCRVPKPADGPYSGHSWDGLITGGGKLHAWMTSGNCQDPLISLAKVYVYAAFDLARNRWEPARYRVGDRWIPHFVDAESAGRFKTRFILPDGRAKLIDWSRSWFKEAATARAPDGRLVIARRGAGYIYAVDPGTGAANCPERPFRAAKGGGVLERVGDRLVYTDPIWKSHSELRIREIGFDAKGCPVPRGGPPHWIRLTGAARATLDLWAKPVVWHPPTRTLIMWNGREQFWAFDDETYALIRSWRVAPHPRSRRMPVRPIYSKMQYLPAVDAFAMYVNPKEGMWLYRLPKDLRGG